MSNWMQRVGNFFGGRAAAAPPRVVRTSSPPQPALAPARVPAGSSASVPAGASAAPDTSADAFVESVLPDLQTPLFEWLTGLGPVLELPLLPNERKLLVHLDALLAADASRAELLPRAPAVIPQLMMSLRDERQSAFSLADRVAKDPNLVAEVLRLANSAMTAAGGEPIRDLAQAISRLGIQGLKRAIAKVVLRPIFDAPPESLSGRAAARLWQHSEAKAAECMRLATLAKLDPFDGYLAGLMHNIGWTATLRALDRADGGAPLQCTRAFVEALAPKRESFFALLTLPWQLTDALTALAVEMLDRGLAANASPLGQSLLAADQQATLEVLGAGGLLTTVDLDLDLAIA